MLKVFCPSNRKKLEVNWSRKKNKFFWCSCENPTIFELRKISDKTKISLSDLKRYSNQKKDSRIITRKNYDIVLLKYPIYKAGKITLKNIELVFNKRFIIVLYADKLVAINDFVKNLKEELVGVKKVDYFYFLRKMLVGLFREFIFVLDKIEIKLEKVEEEVLKPNANIKTLFFVKKNLLYIRKALVDNRNIITDLQEGVSKYLVPNMLSDIYTDFVQILDTEELFRDRLTSTLNLHLSSISNKMNDRMKSFTIVASLLLIPMLIASIYGMNIRLPIQNHPNAFYTIMLIIILSVLSTIIYFKIKKWI